MIPLSWYVYTGSVFLGFLYCLTVGLTAIVFCFRIFGTYSRCRVLLRLPCCCEYRIQRNHTLMGCWIFALRKETIGEKITMYHPNLGDWWSSGTCAYMDCQSRMPQKHSKIEQKKSCCTCAATSRFSHCDKTLSKHVETPADRLSFLCFSSGRW